MSFPLKGIKVLDMSRVLAGPFAGRMLADLGADVVKLEPPDGDVTRLWGREIGGISSYYNQQNAGKRNIAVDLGKPAGVELVKSLVAEADVLIENFRPDVMGRLGLDYDTLSEVNPRLIMLSISGFGADNPDSRRAAYAPIVHAEIGLVARQAEISGAYPAELALSVADTNAGLHGLVGLLAALYARETGGKGDHLEIAMVDASVVTNDGMGFVLDDVPQVVSNEVFETSAGPLMIAGDFRFLWKMLTRHFDVDDGLGDRDVELQVKIDARRAALNRFFNETCSNRESVIAALDKMNIAWGDVRPREQITELASVRTRGTITEVDDRAGGSRPIPETPYRFRHASAQVQGGAPHLGEHNHEVFQDWLGWSTDRLDRFSEVLVGP